MTTDPTDAIARDLLAPTRASDNHPLAMFDPLIGTWSLRSTYQRADGQTIELGGYAHFGWGLRGDALVDIWSFDDGAVGTTIRFYDAAINRIRSTWICPRRNAVLPFLGRVVDGRIVLNACGSDGRAYRWQFVTIEPEQFSWTGEVCDDGMAWNLNQRIEGTRTT